MGSLYFNYPDGNSYKFDGDLLRREISFDNGEIPEYISGFNIPMTRSAEFKAECNVNVPMLKKLCGVDISNGLDMTNVGLILGLPYQEQIRKHKKKRINKKWAKRYGYRTKFRQVIVDEFVCETPNDNEIEVVGRCNADKFIF